MNAELITVGTELLLGETVNTNAAFLSEKLAECGINTYYHTTVGDNPSRIAKALQQAIGRSEIIILTGGLGATDDDITKQTVCEALGIELKEDEHTLQRIRDYYERSGREMTPHNLRQATVPEGAVVFDNDYGTAPGLAVSKGNQHVIMLPGPPRELVPMVEQSVVPYLSELSSRVIVSHTIRMFGVGEAQAADMLGDVFEGSNPTVGIYAANGEVRLRVTASADTKAAAEKLCDPVVKFLIAKMKDYVYSTDGSSLEEVAVSGLKRRGMTVATAESCTAGLLSKRITDVGGSSEVFTGGVAAYAAAVKVKLLGVPESVIRTHGTVSAEVAKRMALGVRNLNGTDLGVGITGVAGESIEGKPSGLVYIAMTDGKHIWVRELQSGRSADEREYVRQLASSHALDMICRYLFALPEVMAGAEVVAAARMTFNPDAVKTAHAGLEISDELSDIEVTDDMLDELFADESAAPELSAAAALNALADLPEEPTQAIAAEQEAQPEPVEDAVIPEETEQEEAFDLHEVAAAIEAGDDQLDGLWDADEPADEQPTEKKPWFTRFLRSFIPWSGDGALEVLRKVVVIVCAVLLVVSCVYIGGSINDRISYDREIEAVRNLYEDDDDGVGEDGMLNKFKKLYEANPDIVGWLTVPGTQTDNPVYQTTDNDYYLTHNSFGEESVYGALFADYRDNVDPANRSQNVVIYGHHMRDGSMLAEIKKYRGIDFYKQNPTITFDTIYGDGTYKVFAAFVTNAEPSGDNGYYFDYCVPSFSSQDDFLMWVEQVRRRSLINTSVDVAENDRILTLSTCTYDIRGVELRFVVMARLLREGESEKVNTSLATQNSKPLYPACWYEKKGGQKPTFEDGLYTWFAEGTDQSVIDQVLSQQQSSSGQTSSGQTSSAASDVSSSSSHSQLSSLPVLPSRPASSTTSSKTSSSAVSSTPSASSGVSSSSSDAASTSSTPSEEASSDAQTSSQTTSTTSEDQQQGE